MMEKINLIIESFDSTRYQCQVTPSETIGHIVGELMQELSVETDGEVPSDIQSVQSKSERPEIQVYLTEEDGSKIRLAPLDLNATFFQEKIADGSILKLTRSVFRDFLTDSGLAKFGQAISNITHRKSQATAIRMDNWLNLSLTLVYIPEEGRCNEFSFSADPGMKVEQLVMDFLYEFTDKGKKGSSQGSAEFYLWRSPRLTSLQNLKK